MYWDLNVAWPNNRTQQKRMVEMAITLGYDGIVFTQTLHDKFTNKMVHTFTSTLQPAQPPPPSPLSHSLPVHPLPPLLPASSTQRNTMTAIPVSELSVPFPTQSSALRLCTSTSPFPLSPSPTFSHFYQKFRLHLHISDASHLTPLSHSSSSPSLLSYDLLSATPTSTDLFHACASSDLLDLITLPCTAKLGFHLRRPSLHMAKERGIALELTYAGGVREGSLRRYMFACGVAVMRMGGGGKGVVVSSGAEREGDMRDVAGVVSIMRLMGMEGERARAALSSNAEAVLWKGETRKTAKAVLRAIRITDRTQLQPQAQSEAEKEVEGEREGGGGGEDEEEQQQQVSKRQKTERRPD